MNVIVGPVQGQEHQVELRFFMCDDVLQVR